MLGIDNFVIRQVEGTSRYLDCFSSHRPQFPGKCPSDVFFVDRFDPDAKSIVGERGIA